MSEKTSTNGQAEFHQNLGSLTLISWTGGAGVAGTAIAGITGQWGYAAAFACGVAYAGGRTFFLQRALRRSFAQPLNSTTPSAQL